MENPQEITELANRRIDEARVLLENNYYEGAIYLAGYAIELSLKSKICSLLDIPNLFSFRSNNIRKEYLRSYKSHDLEQLILLSGLRNKFQDAKSENLRLFENWSVVCEWSEEKRYCKCGIESFEEAEKFINAIIDPQNGIKSWIENH